MSEFHILGTALPPPPTSVTTLQVDKTDATVTTINQPVPTAVTAATNIIIVNGDNGIETDALPTVASNAMQIRFTRGEVTTTNTATPTTVLSFATETNTCLTLQIIVAGYDANGIDGVSAYCTAGVLNQAGVASILGTPAVILTPTAGLVATNVTLAVAGANFLIQVTGDATHTINWAACTPGIIST